MTEDILSALWPRHKNNWQKFYQLFLSVVRKIIRRVFR